MANELNFDTSAAWDDWTDINTGDIKLPDGVRLQAKIEQDDSSDSPWDHEDGHGPVESFHGEPPAGWYVLKSDRWGGWAYDTGAAIVQAAREGWGCQRPEQIRLKPGKTVPTRAQLRYQAVKEDRQRMSDWLNDEWRYAGIWVRAVDEDGKELTSTSLWGIESDAGDYWQEVAHELSTEVVGQLTDATICTGV